MHPETLVPADSSSTGRLPSTDPCARRLMPCDAAWSPCSVSRIPAYDASLCTEPRPARPAAVGLSFHRSSRLHHGTCQSFTTSHYCGTRPLLDHLSHLPASKPGSARLHTRCTCPMAPETKSQDLHGCLSLLCNPTIAEWVERRPMGVSTGHVYNRFGEGIGTRQAVRLASFITAHHPGPVTQFNFPVQRVQKRTIY
jgi:hypothetical protein